MIALVWMVVLSRRQTPAAVAFGCLCTLLVFLLGSWSPSAVAGLLVCTTVLTAGALMFARRSSAPHLWDHSMLRLGSEPQPWYASTVLWWAVLALILVCIYIKFW
jgi:hypothetical protein